jgi:uncharacterized protein YgbK (DUF1537 family)
MVKLGVIADDLTGANDTGLQFAKAGLKTVVVWDLDGIEGSSKADVIVVDAESRRDPAEVAYRKVSEAARRLKESGVELFYKKIDSTLRGNLGSELDGMIDALGSSMVLVAPAFPRNRRITVGGHQIVDSLPLEHTEARSDVATPVKTSHIPTAIGMQSRRMVHQIPLGEVMRGPESIKERIEREKQRGVEILVLDSTTQEELRTIAQAAASLKETPILCGSAGLAEEIPYVFNLSRRRRGILILAGTASSVTSRQIGALERMMHLEVVELKPEDMLGDEGQRNIEIESACRAAKKRLDEGMIVVIRWAEHGLGRENAKGSWRSSSQDEIAILLGALGIVARSLVDESLAGVILTGGDTAMSAMRALEVEGVRISGEVEPGAPIVTAVGGRVEGMRIVTKAGAFGDEQTLVRAVERLRWEG